MVNLRQGDIRVAVVHQGVQVVQRVPGCHALAAEGQELGLLALHEVVGLVQVVQAVELAHPVKGLTDLGGGVVAVGGFVGGLGAGNGIHDGMLLLAIGRVYRTRMPGTAPGQGLST